MVKKPVKPRKPRKPRNTSDIDWIAIRTNYVNNKKTAKALASEYSIGQAAIERRIVIERWSQLRAEVAEAISNQAQAALIDRRVAELVKFNADDLKIAVALKQRAADLLRNNPNANDLRTLASTFEMARRMGLSALGVDESGKLPAGEVGMDLPVTVTIERKSARLSVAST